MVEYYLIIVVILMILAVSNLVVGVANDAVNFVNSAVGSKVASFRTILVVASIGIFVGAVFSSGMMEVARKGIFNPDYFVFSEVMVIFLAVMITNIFLLDLFNTFGLPTSTTVSLIFELLGAAIVVAIVKISQSGESLSTLPEYINTASATAIVSTIFSSIAIAFVAGAFIQYLSRLLFTYQIEQRMKWLGGIWSGLALALITYFLLFKGIKGASFVSEGFIKWVGENTLMLFVTSFVFWSILMQILHAFFKVNILKIVVLLGTFSLAMAFAGNDLVNFIGAPIAGLESFFAWRDTGMGADDFSMNFLKEPVRTNTFLLLAAGFVMVLTLWFSKKARTVTETEVSLGRQDEGTETFSPNAMARALVRYSRSIGKGFQQVIPSRWLDKMDDSFQKPVIPASPVAVTDQPAFDLIRASVNLTVASMLIAFATSLKLPLSTTYVTFMVAMGTSMADRAWGPDSAVYRVAGVLNVVAGWFITAFIALTLSGIIAYLILTFEVWAVGGLMLLLLFVLYRTHILHAKKQGEREVLKAFEAETTGISTHKVIEDTAKKLEKTLATIGKTWHSALIGLMEENRSKIKKSQKELKQLEEQNEEMTKKLYRSIQRIEENGTEASRLYLLIYDLEQDILQSTGFIVDACSEHVENSHGQLKPEQIKNLRLIMEQVEGFMKEVTAGLHKMQVENIDSILDRKSKLFQIIEEQMTSQINGIKSKQLGRRNSMLFFSLLLETKDLIAVTARFVKLYHRLLSAQTRGESRLLTAAKESKPSKIPS